MLSESARATSAEQSRFRISVPNSLPRAIKVVALDEPAGRVVAELAGRGWANVTFLTAADFDSAPDPGTDPHLTRWLHDVDGGSRGLIDEVSTADLVVMIASVGADASAAAIIGGACQLCGVMTTALVVSERSSDEAELARTLAQLRPYSKMLVSAQSADYLSDMLLALRALQQPPALGVA